MVCYECGDHELVPIMDEVDIGIGVLYNLCYYECPQCGQFSICQECKRISRHEPHEEWCEAVEPKKQEGTE